MARVLGDAVRRLRGIASASLGGKLVLILTGVGLVGSIAIALLLAAVITPSFKSLEDNAVTAHVERTRAALDDFANKVETAVRDYGDWNDSYAYMEHPTRAFEEESFSTLAMQNLSVDGMAYIRNNGSVVIARWIDPANGRDVPAMKAELVRRIGGIDLARVVDAEGSGSFYLRFGDSVAAVGVARVRRSDGTGTPRGFVLMARTIGSEQLSTLLQVKAQVKLANDLPEVAITPHAARLDIAVPVRGPNGETVASAAYAVPRDMSLLGRRMLLLAAIGTSLLMIIVLVVLRKVIGQMVLRPLKRVERHMGVVRQSGTLGMLEEKPRSDEIGSLVTSFNSMLRQLKDLREQLEVQSFKLGRSESAVAVMHNVRNALNPISTILSQGLGTGGGADPAMVDRALSELAREDIPAARRQKLVAFLAAAQQAAAGERSERQQQLQLGREALHHVLEIIGKQQEAAHERPQLEACDITDIIAQNATIARYSSECSISFSFPSMPHWVMGNRVILSQVVGNLLGNAAEAITATGRGSGSIAVSVTEDKDKVRVVIRDDGDGFDPENAPTLFQRGFSTRKHKSGGLGLHWCANSMNAMEGKLDLLSEGMGKGARAILTLKAATGMTAGGENIAA